MKRLMAVAATVVALILVATGVGAWAVLDEDDVLRSPAVGVSMAGAAAVTSTPGILAWSGVTAVVEARAAAGDVFIGAAHPVDRRAWLGSRPVREVTQVGRTGITASPPKPLAPSAPVATGAASTEGSELPSLGETAKLDFWTRTVHGADWQRLDLSLTGAPVAYVVLPASAGATVEVRQGLLLPGARRLALALVGGGALLGGLAVLLWRRRPPASQSDTGTDAPWIPEGGSVGTPKPSRERVDVQPDIARRVRVSALGALVVLLLPGCVPVPSSSPVWDEATVAKTALTLPEAGPQWRRMTSGTMRPSQPPMPRGIRRRGRPQMPGSCSIGTRCTRGSCAKGGGAETPSTGVHQAHVVHAAAFRNYPMWALVSGTARFDGEIPLGAVMLMTKESVVAPWRKAGAVGDGVVLPDPITGKPRRRRQRTSTQESRRPSACGIRWVAAKETPN